MGSYQLHVNFGIDTFTHTHSSSHYYWLHAVFHIHVDKHSSSLLPVKKENDANLLEPSYDHNVVPPTTKANTTTSYFAVLSNNKSLNVDCQRCMYRDDDDNIEWCNYLTKLSSLYPGVLRACYVCYATLDKVYHISATFILLITNSCIIMLYIHCPNVMHCHIVGQKILAKRKFGDLLHKRCLASFNLVILLYFVVVLQ